MKAGLILSRLDSSRLPNKAMLNLGEKKLLEWVIDGVKNTEILQPILVTTSREVDDPLVQVAEDNGILVFRGELNNVAKRVYDCLKFFDIKSFARVNGDSPFVLKELYVKAMDVLNAEQDISFVTNLLPRHYPYGISVEMFRTEFFYEYYPFLNTASFQEHLSSWIYSKMEKDNRIYKLFNEDVDHHSTRAVIDTEEDYQRIARIVKQNRTFDFYNCTIKELIKKIEK